MKRLIIRFIQGRGFLLFLATANIGMVALFGYLVAEGMGWIQ
jgi:hypothetical protein